MTIFQHEIKIWLEMYLSLNEMDKVDFFQSGHLSMNEYYFSHSEKEFSYIFLWFFSIDISTKKPSSHK